MKAKKQKDEFSKTSKISEPEIFYSASQYWVGLGGRWRNDFGRAQ